MKKQCLILFCLTLLLASCSKKNISLASTPYASTDSIFDISSAYVFWDSDAKEIEINRKNSIGSTHWILHIDKRIPMHKAAKAMQFFYEKRHKKSMHTNKDAKLYLSLVHSELKKLAFLENTQHNFTPLKNQKPKANTLFIGQNNWFFKGQYYTSTDALLTQLITHTQNHPLYLCSDASISFEKYIQTRSWLQHTLGSNKIAPTEYYKTR